MYEGPLFAFGIKDDKACMILLEKSWLCPEFFEGNLYPFGRFEYETAEYLRDKYPDIKEKDLKQRLADNVKFVNTMRCLETMRRERHASFE